MPRFFHISDIHVAATNRGWAIRDFFSKHVTGWVNWNLLGRGVRFSQAAQCLEKFERDVRLLQPDAVIFSGDATALGFATEANMAASLLKINEFPGVAVPGNHDHYTRQAVAQRRFEAAFEPWLQGKRMGSETYPFARCFNDIWFVCVNAAVPNRGITDASGLVGNDQLRRLDQLLSQLPDGRRVLVTHYPYVTAEGLAEPEDHRLRDRDALRSVVVKHGIKTWLCGHRHQYYQFGPSADAPIHIICAGSSTMIGTAGYWDITFADNGDVSAIRRDLSV